MVEAASVTEMDYFLKSYQWAKQSLQKKIGYLLFFKHFKPKAFLFLYIFVIIYILEVPGHSHYPKCSCRAWAGNSFRGTLLLPPRDPKRDKAVKKEKKKIYI